jgi:hypothetical protein
LTFSTPRAPLTLVHLTPLTLVHLTC